MRIYECVWRRKRQKIKMENSGYSAFYYQNRVHESEIMDEIQSGRFFGIACVSINTPSEAREKFARANFPPLFKRSCPQMSDLSQSMKDFYQAYGTKPRSQLTVGYS